MPATLTIIGKVLPLDARLQVSAQTVLVTITRTTGQVVVVLSDLVRTVITNQAVPV